jgi:hypothetical protein
VTGRHFIDKKGLEKFAGDADQSEKRKSLNFSEGQHETYSYSI